MTLRRGKAVEYRQGPVKATGPAPVPGRRRCRKPSGATAHRSPRSSPAFLPVPAIRATPAPLSRRTLTGHLPPNTPSSIAAGCPRVQPDGMTFPGHHRGGLPGDAGVSLGWPPVGRGPGTGQVPIPIHIPKGGNQMRPYRFQPYRRAGPARTNPA